VPFDNNYNIRSVVAIAPVFETYTPRGRHLPLENVNYFVLHGSNDTQILTFKGLSQYARAAFTDEESWFKAALYIYRANHVGQSDENLTVWREQMVELIGAELVGPIVASPVYLGLDAERSQGVVSYAISL